jgi:hypothetical protein
MGSGHRVAVDHAQQGGWYGLDLSFRLSLISDAPEAHEPARDVSGSDHKPGLVTSFLRRRQVVSEVRARPSAAEFGHDRQLPDIWKLAVIR